MQCPQCKKATSVLETRVIEKTVRRRRECSCGHRFITREVFVADVKPANVPNELAQSEALEMLGKGVKPKVVAFKLGVSVCSIYRWRALAK